MSRNIVIAELSKKWQWNTLTCEKRVKNLVYTSGTFYRRDMKVSQRVGSRYDYVKFKFNHHGAKTYPENFPDNHSFTVSLHQKKSPVVIVWETCSAGTVLQARNGSILLETGNILDWVQDPENMTEDDWKFIEHSLPIVAGRLSYLLPGLENIDGELRKRF